MKKEIDKIEQTKKFNIKVQILKRMILFINERSKLKFIFILNCNNDKTN